MYRRVNRLPITLLFVGLLFKTALVVLFRVWHAALVLRLALYYDPGAWQFAEKMTNLFISHEPTRRDAAVFDISLVIGFGIECFLIGLALRWLVQLIRSRSTVDSAFSSH